jgi:hypothetical protein
MRNRLSKILLCFLAIAAVACKKDKTDQQAIAFSVKITQKTALPAVVTPADEINFDLGVEANAEATIAGLELSLDGTALTAATGNGTNKFDLQHTYKPTSLEVGRSLIFKLKVTNQEGQAVEKDFVVYVQSAPANIAIVLPATAPTEIMDNETADFNIAVTSENDIRYIKTFLNQTEIAALTKTTFANPKADSYQFVYQPQATDIDKNLEFYIEVMDNLGNLVRHPFTIAVKRSVAVDFNVYTDVVLGAQRSTGPGPFFNASTGEVYVTSGVAAKAAGVDLVTFYSGSTNSYNLTSPTLATVAANIYTVALYGADALDNWSTRNKTLIKKITLSQNDFDLIGSAADIQNLYTSSSVTATETSGGMANGNVIVFLTANNKYGVLLLKARSANANTGNVTVDVKVQK